VIVSFLSATRDTNTGTYPDRPLRSSRSGVSSSRLGDLYSRLGAADKHVLTHTIDAFLKMTTLFCCVEVKPARGDRTEAEY
jgi:hypothetical protein